MNRLTAILSVGLLALVSALTGCSSDPAEPAAADPPLTAQTSSGMLHGLTTASAREFLGVRYAQPPTGDLRWKPPQPAPAAPGVVDATKPGATCAQASTLPGAQPSAAEDCLFLNVTTPRQMSADAKLPVMVWWHGGGFTSGSGAAYDAQRLASRGNVIVVTVNYRLGVFGYFGLPGLQGSGTFGLADQIAGARWAKQNAAAFGGDPGNITVFGESAGGMSACGFLTSPAADGLADKVAISSGSCMLNWPAGVIYPGLPADSPYKPLAATEQRGEATAKTLGCQDADPIECLRKQPVSALMKVSGDFSNGLTYGTDLLPQAPADALQAGKVANIPVLSGGNRDEHNAFVSGDVAADPTTITAATYPTLVATAFGAAAPEVLQRYPLSKFPSAPAAWAKVTSDSTWACQTLAGNRAMATKTKVYGYEFADPNPPNVNGNVVPGLTEGGAAHATDLPFLFDLGGRNLVIDPAKAQLADAMIDYWSSFARTGVPTAPGGPVMQPMTPDSSTVLALAPNAIRTDDTSATHQCDFWQHVPTQ